MPDQAVPATPMLEAQLGYRRGGFQLNLQIAAPRGVVALFGASGCGKSTAINLLAGLLRPDSGHLRLGAQVLFDAASGIDVPAHRRRIGYVFQDARLFPHLRVRANLSYGLRRSSQTIAMDFDSVVNLLGLETLLERWPTGLSGGEQQRVAIGRALLSQPQLLLLDEPLASLDQARREEVLPYLEKLRDTLGIPMVYVSHQFEEVLRLAAHVVVMERGRCVAQGELTMVSLQPEMRRLLGAEAMGAVVDAQVEGIDVGTGLAQLRLGDGQLQIESGRLRPGQAVRLQLLARDLILSLGRPQGLSVRNALAATVTRISRDDDYSTVVELDAGGQPLLARITSAAADELALHPGLRLWALVKTVTLRGHARNRRAGPVI